MSKIDKVIAGLGVCAGLGVALAPLSAFAAPLTSITDTLQVTVGDSVTIGLDVDGDGDYSDEGDVAPVVHTDGDGTWGGNALTPANPNLFPDTLSKTMVQGETTDELGTTTLTIFSSKAYKVTGRGNTVTGANLPARLYSTTQTGWAYKPSVTGSLSLAGTISDAQMNAASTTEFDLATASAASVAAGDTLEVVYGVGVAANEQAGTYTGSMTYTVTQTL